MRTEIKEQINDTMAIIYCIVINYINTNFTACSHH